MNDVVTNLLDDNIGGRPMSPLQAQRIKDELARLREENASLVDRHNRKSHGTASHEALAYDAVVQERDRLREERDAWKDSCEEQIALLMKTADQRDTLLAALREIAVKTRYGCCKPIYPDSPVCAHNIARAAISEVEGEK